MTRMDDEWSYPLHILGSASTAGEPDESESDCRVRKLREIVEEVTRQPVDEPAKPRMGFLP